MKYFHSGPGAPPYFRHRIKVLKVTNDMYEWCEAYPLNGDCERWHIEWKGTHTTRQNDVIQFESEKAAYMFTIAFSEYIINK